MNCTTLIKKLEQKIWNLEKDPFASCEVRSYGLWQIDSDSGQGKYIGFLFIIIFPKSHWATSLLFLAIGQNVILACKIRIFIFIHLWGIVRLLIDDARISEEKIDLASFKSLHSSTHLPNEKDKTALSFQSNMITSGRLGLEVCL